MKLLVDKQLPLALARHLTSLGHECEHVEAVHLDAASDAEIWQYASQRNGRFARVADVLQRAAEK